MSEPEQTYTGAGDHEIAPTSLTSSETLLSALLSVEINLANQDLLSALLAMDRENLQASMTEVPSNAGPMRRKKINCVRFQPARIKRIIQSDEEIGRIKDGVPAAIGKAMEHFAEVFLQECAKEANMANSRQLKPLHLKAAMLKNPCFAFLEKVLGEVAGQHSKKIKAPNTVEQEKENDSASSISSQ